MEKNISWEKKNKGYDTVIHLPFKYILVNYHPLIKRKLLGWVNIQEKNSPNNKKNWKKKSHIQEAVKW